MWGDAEFIRAKFHQDNEAAKDLTQGFFASALERDFFQRFDPSKAGFRTYLRLAVERFAANRHQAENRRKRGGGVEFAELDAQSASTESPEKIYLREWRRQLFALAIEACGPSAPTPASTPNGRSSRRTTWLKESGRRMRNWRAVTGWRRAR
jgi:DNA-directed RNA polymerase specialized sigma24 family protein